MTTFGSSTGFICTDLGQISSDRSIQDRLSGTNNGDIFAFTLNGTSQINFRLRYSSSSIVDSNVRAEVFRDLDGDGFFDANEPVLSRFNTDSGTLTLSGGDYGIGVFRFRTPLTVNYTLTFDFQGSSPTPNPNPNLPGTLNTPFTRVHDLAKQGSYLFVAPSEADSLRNNSSRYDDQGFAFAAAASPQGDPLLRPFIRYVDTALGREGNYLYVAEPEAASIDVNNPNFVKQGVAFYAYYGGQGSNTINFHRFITSSGAYFFAGDGETNAILGGLPPTPGQIAPNGFTYQGVAFAAGG